MEFTPSHDPASRPRLLLAYADPGYASRVARTFRRLGWKVRMAATVAEAARLIDADKPHVALLDLELHDESGCPACTRIAERHPDQRVILLSPKSPENVADLLRSTGAVALVDRGDSMETLVRAAYGQSLARAV